MRGVKVKYYKDAKGEWRWRFVAINGKILADSGEGYKNLKDAKHGYKILLTMLADEDVKK